MPDPLSCGRSLSAAAYTNRPSWQSYWHWLVIVNGGKCKMKSVIKSVILLVSFILLAVAVAPTLKGEVTTNEKTPTDMAVFVPCANGGVGEMVMLSGELHTLISSTENKNVTRYKFHFQPQGMSGVGEDTGDKYQATGVTQTVVKAQVAPGEQYQETFVNNFRIIGAGPGNNYLVHEVFHVTVNANGEVSVEFDHFTVECK